MAQCDPAEEGSSASRMLLSLIAGIVWGACLYVAFVLTTGCVSPGVATYSQAQPASQGAGALLRMLHRIPRCDYCPGVNLCEPLKLDLPNIEDQFATGSPLEEWGCQRLTPPLVLV